MTMLSRWLAPAVLATGLGKTWLAAFDSRAFARVLFVAHRDEILTQAMAAFRRIRPEARFGRFDGAEKDEGADILFASIQTIGRVGHLRRFAPKKDRPSRCRPRAPNIDVLPTACRGARAWG